MRSPLTEKFQRVTSLIDEVNALPEDERGLFLDLLQPETEEQPKQKKTRKKRASKQRVGIQAVLAEARPDLCVACNHPEDYQDHTGPSPNRHDFIPSKAKTTAASGD